MIFQPIIPVMLLVLVGIGLIAGIGWGMWRFWKRPRLSHTFWRALGLGVCLFGIAVGISFPGEKSPAGMVNLDVIFVIDRTASMSAEDYDGAKPRLDGVKSDALELTKKLTGARIGLITFDSDAQNIVPFTNDTSAVTTAIATLDQEKSSHSHGSSIDKPLALTKKLLEQSAASHPERGRLIFYFGDGEQTTETKVASFSPIGELTEGGAILGYGTSAGGKMKSYSGYSFTSDTYSPSYIIDYTTRNTQNDYSVALSKIDEGNLKKIASDIHIPYEHRTTPTQTLDQLVTKSNMHVVSESHRQVLHYTSTYWLFAIAAGALLIWWWLDLLQALRATQRGLTQ